MRCARGFVAGCVVVVVLATCGCTSPIDPAAEARFLGAIGDTTMTVYPVFVRDGTDVRHDAAAAAELAAFFSDENLAEASVSDEEITPTGAWHTNQSKMWRESAATLSAYVAENPIDTEYAVLPEYLIGGAGVPVGIHCYIVEADGTLCYGVGLNSHHDVFADADPQTVEDCTAVLITYLREELVQ